MSDEHVMGVAPPQRTAGRRRDDGIDKRIHGAAVELYAEQGWGRFNFDAVARRANVGKPALYRRFDGRESLLIASLEALDREHPRIDTGSVRTDLVQYVRQAFDFRMSVLGRALLRMLADQHYHPELGSLSYERIIRPKVREAREIMERAQRRNELPATTDVNLLLEALDGAVMNRVNDTRPESRAKLGSTIDQYAEDLVALLLGHTVVPAQRPV